MRIIGHRSVLWTAACAVCIASFTPAARAELREKLPQQTLVYIELAGTEKCGAAMKTTPFGQLLERPDVQELGKALWNAGEGLLMAEAQREGAGETATAAKDVLLSLWKKGLAIDLADVRFSEMGPTVSFIIASDMGADAEAFLQKFDALLDTAPLPPRTDDPVGDKAFKQIQTPMPMPLPVRYGVVDGVFLLTVGDATTSEVLASMGGEAPPLATNERLTAAMKRIGVDNRVTTGLLHIDVVAALEHGRQVFAAMSGQPEPGFPPPVEAIIEEVGVGAMQSLTMCSQIADQGFRSSVLLASTNADKGLLKALQAKPLTDEDLMWIPMDAAFASACNFELTALYDELLRLVQVIPDAPAAELQDAIAQAEQAMGLKIRDDILGVFGDGWITFDAPSTGGLIITGLTVAVEVRDGEAAGKLLRRAADALVDAAGHEVSVSVVTTDRGKYQVNFLQFANAPIPVAPAWALINNRLVIGLMPQTVDAVADRVLADDPKASSILTNPDFVRGRKLLPESLTSISYIDTAAGMRQLYPLLSMGGTVAIDYARSIGAQVDASMIPSRAAVTGNLYGDVSGVAANNEGFLQVTHGPLPVPIPSLTAGGFMTVPTLVSALMPSTARARGEASALASSANLKGIGVACMIYAYDNQEKYPPDLQTLVDSGDISERQLISPQAPQGMRSYAYIPGHTMKSDPSWVVAYEQWPGQPEDGAPVLFVDGHVEVVRPLSRVEDLVEKTMEAMAQQKQ